MTVDMPRSVVTDGLRFLIAGGLNTALTLVVYQALLFILSPSASYAISWCCGLFFVISFYPSRVFSGACADVSARVRLGISYAVLFLLGLGALRLLGWAGVSPRLAILVVLGITTASNFLVGRCVLRPAPEPIDTDAPRRDYLR